MQSFASDWLPAQHEVRFLHLPRGPDRLNKDRMVLSSQRVSLFLILFLVVNPALLVPGDEVNSQRWKDYGCMRVIKAAVKDGVNMPFWPVVDTGNKELHDGLDRIAKWASQNMDKLAGGASILVSSCLLYDTILLTLDIEGFFDEITELRGKFDAFVLERRPQLERLLAKIRLSVDAGKAPDEKDVRQIHYVLTLYHGDISDVLDKVGDLIEEAREAEWDAKFTGVLSAVVFGVAGFALTKRVPSDLAKHGLVATTGLSAGAGVLSLKNVYDCKQALRELDQLKKNLRLLKSQAGSWMKEMMYH